MEDVNEIHIYGEIDLNKRFLEFLSQKEIILHFYNNYGYYSGSYYPREHLNSGYMILRQAEHYLDAKRRIVLARTFVQGAAGNMQEVLKYYVKRGKDVNTQLENITTLKDRIPATEAVDVLMAIEGNIRDAYYSAFNTIIDKSEFHFDSRNRRPPRDRQYLLALAILAYTLFMRYIEPFDPRICFTTTNFRRSFNLMSPKSSNLHD